MTNSVVVGLGMVGKATAHSFHITKYIDIEDKNIEGMDRVGYKEAADNRYIFLCLPTPVDSQGNYQTDSLLEAMSAIKDQGKQNVFIIRSTVYPGFARYAMNTLGISWIVSNPEFLTEATWQKDSEHPDLVVIGADRNNYLEDVEGLYKSRFKGVDIIKTDTITAELTKLSINGFYSTKVVYANQLFDYAQKVGANYETIKEAMYKRKWIGNNHLDIFHQGGRGAGGKCLPKDLKALANYSGQKLFNNIDSLNTMYLQESGKK